MKAAEAWLAGRNPRHRSLQRLPLASEYALGREAAKARDFGTKRCDGNDRSVAGAHRPEAVAKRAEVSGSGLSRRAGRGLAWVVAGAGAQTAAKLVVLAVLARLLTPAEFGLVATATMILALAQFAGRLGVGQAVVQVPELTQARLRAAMAISLVAGFLGGAAMWLAAQPLEAFFAFEGLAPLVRALALVPPLFALSQIPEALLQRDLAFRQLTLIDGAGYVIGYGAVALALALAGWGAWALIAAMIGQEVLRTVALIALRPGFGAGPVRLRELRPVLRYGASIAAVQLTNVLAYQADNFVVARTLGAAPLGVYSRAYQVMTVPTKLLGNSLLKVLFPAMAQVQADRDRLARGLTRAVSGVALICLPAASYLAVLAPEIVSLMLGSQWGAVVVPFQILASAIVFRVAQRLFEAVARACDLLGRLWLLQALYAGSVLALAWIGHPWGLPGVAAGVAIAVALNTLLLAELACRATALPRGALLRPLVRPAVIAFGFTGLLAAAVAALRAADFPDLAVLGMTGIGAAAVGGLLLAVAPSLFGAEGARLARALSDRLAARQAGPSPTAGGSDA